MPQSLICISHLRWNFVYQRPQHLMSRFRQHYRVYFVEEPVYDAPSRYNEILVDASTSVTVVTPHLPSSAKGDAVEQRALLDLLIKSEQIENMVLWYYSPLGLAFTEHLEPELVVYDCMDELSAFRFAPPELREFENKLMKIADIVFTGGNRLYEAKKDKHQNIHAFPSSIDKDHFEKARRITEDPKDMAAIPHPRIGFYGVVDERFDIQLLSAVAILHPEWQFVIIGPTAKIDLNTLPRFANIHFLGSKDYKELPVYLAGWDVAMMPFAINESTEFISPTKTPEYLAGGKPVVSTPIADVVKPYGELGLVEIAGSPAAFADSIEKLLGHEDNTEWLEKVDKFLAGISWNKTWMQMTRLMKVTTAQKKELTDKNKKAYV